MHKTKVTCTCQLTLGSIGMVVSKTKHSKTKTEARSTQNSKTKHPKHENEAPKIENEAPKTRKRSTQNSKTKHRRSKTKHPKLENEAPKIENEAPKTRKLAVTVFVTVVFKRVKKGKLCTVFGVCGGLQK